MGFGGDETERRNEWQRRGKTEEIDCAGRRLATKRVQDSGFICDLRKAQWAQCGVGLCTQGAPNRKDGRNSSEMLPESFNLLDYRVKEVAKSCRLEMVSNSNPFYVEKAIVCSDDDKAGEFVLMALISEGRVGVWRSKDERWAIIDFGYESFYCKDIIYHNKKLYAMGFDGITVAVDPKSLNVTEAAAAPGKSQSHLMMHSLVKSRDDLFLINKYWLYKYYQHGPLLGRICLDVFKLDEEKCEWIEEDGLKDQVLFLGEDGSFMLSAKELPACKGNCGYLMYMDLGGADFKFYHPTEAVAYFDLEDPSPRSQPAALSKYSEAFWPPPTCLRQKQNSC
ncbi:F-box protein SKIP23-like [Pistacia vera]|uniref:F-box protein SKIP23-like n=1 Tax=Pistacia vera TaxID=55513 RepID=UPI0012638240|nr:F-box protein SKIP23-like [Pistacia vera]